MLESIITAASRGIGNNLAGLLWKKQIKFDELLGSHI